MIHLDFERHRSWLAKAMGDRGQGGVRHREHVSPLEVLVVERSAHLH